MTVPMSSMPLDSCVYQLSVGLVCARILAVCIVLCHPTHTHTQPFNGILSGTTRVGRYQKKHSPTHTHPDHQTSFINFLHLLRSICSIYVLDSPFWQPLSRSSLVFLLVLDPLLHAPCISSSSHYFLYAIRVLRYFVRSLWSVFFFIA